MDGATPDLALTQSHRSTQAAQFILSLSQLEREITELAGHLNAASYRWLCLIEEFDRRHGWSDGALHSCAHWLNFKCGVDLGAAREKVRVAHALTQLPKIGAAMARGELSYSKVRALTRVAVAATEEYFLSIALHGTAHHVERLVRYYRRASEVKALDRDARQQENRHFSYRFDEDGGVVFKGSLSAEAGALLIQALEAAMEDLPPVDVAAATSEIPINRRMRRADALSALAESFLREGNSDQRPRTGRTADRYQVVVNVEAQTLREDAPGRCEIERGGALAAETVRRIACDASLVRVTENERGEPLAVGRKTRSIPPAIRRALNSRDSGCRFPGCTHQRYVDAHHIRHWVHGGKTDLANLVTLCRFHHRYVHEEHITVETQAPGAWRFLRPDGTEFGIEPKPTPAYGWSDLLDEHEKQGIVIDSRTAATRWRGERMDYGLAVQVLLQQAERGQTGSSAPDADPDEHDRFAEQESFAEQDVAAAMSEADLERQRRNEQGIFWER